MNLVVMRLLIGTCRYVTSLFNTSPETGRVGGWNVDFSQYTACTLCCKYWGEWGEGKMTYRLWFDTTTLCKWSRTSCLYTFIFWCKYWYCNREISVVCSTISDKGLITPPWNTPVKMYSPSRAEVARNKCAWLYQPDQGHHITSKGKFRHAVVGSLFSVTNQVFHLCKDMSMYPHITVFSEQLALGFFSEDPFQWQLWKSVNLVSHVTCYLSFYVMLKKKKI